jgi:hypothetical protein
MIPRPSRTLRYRNLNQNTGRAELSVTIAGLAEKVEHLALQVKRFVATSAAANAEPAAKPLSALRCAIETGDRLSATSPAAVAQAVDVMETANFPLSPHQENWPHQGGRGDIVDHLNAKVEAAPSESKDENPLAKNGFAERVLELHDRLGGFIKPALPVSSEQKH